MLSKYQYNDAIFLAERLYDQGTCACIFGNVCNLFSKCMFVIHRENSIYRNPISHMLLSIRACTAGAPSLQLIPKHQSTGCPATCSLLPQTEAVCIGSF